jgi:hypothetical protein
MTVPDESLGLWARCAMCGHCWIGARYPAPLEQFARAMKKGSSCPRCGGRGLLAKQEDGRLLEPGHHEPFGVTAFDYIA